MTIDPSIESPQNIYKLLTGAVVPRPIAFVSSLSADGIPNLAPFSFFTVISANPPVICFSPMIRSSDSSRKDTLNNIEATREFSVNIVSEDFVAKMNLCAPEYPPDVNEFEVSGLTPIASDLIHPARVKESRIQMECRLIEVVHVSAKPLGGSLVIGEVIRFHVADDLNVTAFRVEPDRLNAVGRMGGPTYARTTDRFDLERPHITK
ncbi:MAG TPA: flavin reductase family protein [Bryobacteraceae bacterium]|jgi:flavin reductase (DIM6/NTAB) family NADH-FMN oxidoreductase RutF